MTMIRGAQIMSHPLLRLLPSARSVNVGFLHHRSVATAPPPHHQPKHQPNPGNFANRSHEELSAIGHKGGKKGGKATGARKSHVMDPGKHDASAAKDGRGRPRRKTPEPPETEQEAEKRGLSHEPSVVPPGFEEWKTCA